MKNTADQKKTSPVQMRWHMTNRNHPEKMKASADQMKTSEGRMQVQASSDEEQSELDELKSTPGGHHPKTKRKPVHPTRNQPGPANISPETR